MFYPSSFSSSMHVRLFYYGKSGLFEFFVQASLCCMNISNICLIATCKSSSFSRIRVSMLNDKRLQHNNYIFPIEIKRKRISVTRLNCLMTVIWMTSNTLCYVTDTHTAFCQWTFRRAYNVIYVLRICAILNIN